LRLLLDTHALLWWGEDSPRLGRNARAGIDSDDNQIFVSAVSAMEIATKVRLGKLIDVLDFSGNFETIVQRAGFQPLQISIAHALKAGSMPISHGDPFDRLLIAQAMIEGLTLVSNEKLFDGFGVARLW